MFSYIRGTVAERGNGIVVIDVVGVGFKLYTSQCTLADSRCAVGQEATLHTYMYIKEGIMDLYGFATKEELELFLLLISVNGVGAKGAVSILSVASTDKLCLSIVTDDVNTIKQAAGIGAKTAQRICLELKDKIKNEAFVSGDTDAFIPGAPVISGDNVSEAISALVALGYSTADAQRGVRGAAADDSVEDIIKKALKALM
ncbi:MAG: Holliday junction branch migration protein RuvA [Clostridia bacterium]|nr:Holliday junction branch migration protein RuvA [Clostridia bacterium]